MFRIHIHGKGIKETIRDNPKGGKAQKLRVLKGFVRLFLSTVSNVNLIKITFMKVIN